MYLLRAPLQEAKIFIFAVLHVTTTSVVEQQCYCPNQDLDNRVSLFTQNRDSNLQEGVTVAYGHSVSVLSFAQGKFVIVDTHNVAILSFYLACEQAMVGDRTKENTGSEASRGETVPRWELAEEELGGGRGRRSL